MSNPPSSLQNISAVLLMCAAAFAGLSGGVVYPLALLLLRLIVLFGLIAWSVHCIRRQVWQLPNSSILWATLGIMFWAGITTIFSPYTFASLQNLADFALAIGGMFLAAQLSQTQREHLYSVLFWIALFLGVFGLLQVMGFRPTQMFIPERISSSYFNSNHYSGWLDVIIPLALWMWLKTRSGGLLWLLGVLLVNLALSFSWAVVGIAVSGGWLLLSHGGKIFARRFLTVGIGMVIIFAVLIGFSPQLKANSFSSRAVLFFDQFVRVSLGTRLEVFKGNWQMIQDHPIVGVGPGNYTRAFPQYRTPVVGKGIVAETTHFFVNYAHNDYMQVATEQGVPGVLLFGLVLFLALRHPTQELGAKAALLALVIHGLVDANMTYIPGNQFLTWVMIGCIAANSPQVQGKSNESNH
jgi:O-antigen ligase